MTINTLNDIQNIYNRQYTKEVSDSIERIDTGLKINKTADNPAAAIISSSLRSNSTGLLQGIENANLGIALVQVTNKSLDFQEEVLEKIKEQLTVAKTQDDTSRETIRGNIQSLIEEFDEIASTTSYNNNFTLQESNSSNNTSLQLFIGFTQQTDVTTPSIQSNSVGVNLTDLNNLSSGELTTQIIESELENIDTAINTLNEFKDAFALTQEELKISAQNLTTIEEGTKRAELELTQANIPQEQIIFDRYKLLLDTSEYAITQANLRQESVLDLLTSIPDYQLPVEESKEDDNTIETDTNQREEQNINTNRFFSNNNNSDASNSSNNNNTNDE